MRKVLAITKNREAVRTLRSFFRDHEVIHGETLEDVIEQGRDGNCEFVFVDITQLAAVDSATKPIRERLRLIWKFQPGANVVVMGELAAIRKVVRAMKAGATDYLTYPLNTPEIALICEYVLETERADGVLEYLEAQVWHDDVLEIVQATKSPKMLRVLEELHRAAQSNPTVLLRGETGTGKTLLARVIHQLSRRADEPFIALHCGAISESLLESELFGHERGAFTGAVKKKLGRFELANGGTIFLDEVGTMSHAMQIKLLQVLQDRTFQRVGGEETLSVDVRVIAASNDDLKQLVADGRFRNDLMFRLNIFPIDLPPLRERREDIPQLMTTLIDRANRRHGCQIEGVHPAVLEVLVAYDWPGNIRELEGLIERACILETADVLTPASFPCELFPNNLPYLLHEYDGEQATLEPLATVRKRASESAEKQYLAEQLRRQKGSIKRTAEASGITARQLHKLMTRHELHKEDYRIAHRGPEVPEDKE